MPVGRWCTEGGGVQRVGRCLQRVGRCLQRVGRCCTEGREVLYRYMGRLLFKWTGR